MPEDDKTQMPAWPSEANDGTMPIRNGMAVASLVLGIVAIPGILFLYYLDAVPIVLAVVFGIFAIRAVRRGSSNRKGFGIAGIVCAAIAAVLLTVVIIVNQRAISDCKHKIGPNATSSQIKQCLKDKQKDSKK